MYVGSYGLGVGTADKCVAGRDDTPVDCWILNDETVVATNAKTTKMIAIQARRRLLVAMIFLGELCSDY